MFVHYFVAVRFHGFSIDFHYFILVLQLTYELLGLIAKEYPDSLVDDYETQIRDLFFNTLEVTLLNQQEVHSIKISSIVWCHTLLIFLRYSILFCHCAVH